MSLSLAGMVSNVLNSASQHARDDGPKADPSRASGAEMVARDGRGFSFKKARLAVEAAGGMARVILEQEFANPYDTVLDVTYRMPLPDDAAVAGYSFELQGRRIHGEIDTKQNARERYTQAVASGHSAALLESQRSNFFTQEIGNIPPKESITVRITLEQKLTYLPDGHWEFRFPTVIGPRYLAHKHSDVATVTATDKSALSVRMDLDLRVADVLPAGETVASSTHRLRVRHASGGRSIEAAFEEGSGVRLDRDIVVRWKVASRTVGLSIVTGRPEAKKPHARSAYGLLTVTPPEPDAMEACPRDLLVLIDTSGSMAGQNLAQAKRAVLALLDTLGERDQFELIEFSDAPRNYLQQPVFASKAAKQNAVAWVSNLEAGSCTEMYTAIQAALARVRAGSQRQVLVLTDGYIGNEREIIQHLSARRPEGCRLHVVGIGAAVNRALTQPLARAGRGIETLLDDSTSDVERSILPLARRMALPILTDVEVFGDALLEQATAYLPDVFQGSPLLASLKLRPEGGMLNVKGMTATGIWTHSVLVPQTAAGAGEPMVVSLYARECVQDLETRWAMNSGDTASIDAEIETIGMVFQIVTRKTSFVAIDTDKVHARRGFASDDVPQELPHGMLALAAPARATAMHPASPRPGMFMPAPAMSMGAPPPTQSAPAPRASMQSPMAPRSAPAMPMLDDADDEATLVHAESLSVSQEAAPDTARMPAPLQPAEVRIAQAPAANIPQQAPAAITPQQAPAAITPQQAPAALTPPQAPATPYRTLAIVAFIVALLLALVVLYFMLRGR
jgi:Ca-activated chloride channel homolog